MALEDIRKPHIFNTKPTLQTGVLDMKGLMIDIIELYYGMCSIILELDAFERLTVMILRLNQF